MSELTLNQTIKIIIGVLIVVVVLIAVIFAFRNYIIPYFAGISPSNELDLTQPFYIELMKPEHLITVTTGDGKKIGNFDPSYYFLSVSSGDKILKLDLRGNMFQRGLKSIFSTTTVGTIDKNTKKVYIYEQYVNDPANDYLLLKLSKDSYFINGGFFSLDYTSGSAKQ